MSFVQKSVRFLVTKAPEDGAEASGDERIIEGYGSTFEPPERADSYGDIIAPGAFKDAIAAHNAGDFRVKLFLRHQIGIGPILEMREDDKGLWLKARVSKTRDGDEALELAKDDVLDSMSIGFAVDSEDDYEDLEVMSPHGYPVRRYNRVGLKEVSLVEIPANEFARVTEVRSARREAYQQRSAATAPPADTAAVVTTEKAPEDIGDSPASEMKGEALGALVSKLVEENADALGVELPEVMSDAAGLAGISVETLREIMEGADVCPTLATLLGLGEALGEPIEMLVEAATMDGCTYEMDDLDDLMTEDEEAAEDTPQADAMPERFTRFLEGVRDLINDMLDPSI